MKLRQNTKHNIKVIIYFLLILTSLAILFWVCTTNDIELRAKVFIVFLDLYLLVSVTYLLAKQTQDNNYIL